ncbi:MAG: glutamate racemase [Ardenticatenaceae bacterium]|nr:glutamate racemase [Anaerolineales bacterium]MCB8921109.1 glutamate racemase [Ardenticatenaceae bacterium]MCB8990814.1 glutamate racemase [Ardenticatenaceae bacterium]MCB9004492.1 glutamate racemase [Ardenticatenaceae bacterium]
MIGLLDSGVGGLSVLRHVQAQLPHEALVYVADQAHVPYGTRSAAEVQQFSEGISRLLLELGVKIIVVACNTASAAALTYLRETFPDVPFVGMEPAVKPAAEHTRTGKVGVMATAGTFGSERYADLMQRFARDVVVFEDPCLGLVDLIEAGNTTGAETEQLLTRVLHPMLAQGVDSLVLGCTHYPFVRPLIEQVIAAAPVKPATAVTIIDPAPAVARQTRRVMQQRDLLSPVTSPGTLRLFTSGSDAHMADLVAHLWGQQVAVETAVWHGKTLICKG